MRSLRQPKKIFHRLFLVALVSAFCGCKEQIIHNLLETEANKLLTVLHQAQIEARKVRQSDGRWMLEVEKEDSLRAIKYLDDTRMLKDMTPATLEKQSMVSSPEEQRFHHERALSHEIEATLSSLRQVLEARVHLNLPPLDPLFGQAIGSKEGSASVLLIAQKEFELQKSEIAQLVAGAAGIRPESISVLISYSNGTSFAGVTESAANTKLKTALVADQKELEQTPQITSSEGTSGALTENLAAVTSVGPVASAEAAHGTLSQLYSPLGVALMALLLLGIGAVLVILYRRKTLLMPRMPSAHGQSSASQVQIPQA